MKRGRTPGAVDPIATSRVADYTAFMYLGELIEFGSTDDLFRNPKKQATED